MSHSLPINAVSLLRALGITTIREPDASLFCEIPVEAMYADFSPRTMKTLRRSLPVLEECVSMIDFMIREGSNISNCGGLDHYVRKRFENPWREAHRSTAEDLRKVYEVKKRWGETRPVDFCSTINHHLKVDFNESECGTRIQSSDYWAEQRVGRVDSIYVDYNFSESFGRFETNLYFKYIRYLAYTPMPKIMFPRLYDFVCGIPQKITRCIDFKFVAKFLDCTPEGLCNVARHFIEHYMNMNTPAEKVDVDLDSVSIENIQYETRDFADVVRESIKNDLLGENRYYEADCDVDIDGNFQQDQVTITFVTFTCTFDASVTAVPEGEPQIGILLDRTNGELLAILRHVFENPLRYCSDGDQIFPNPTLEELDDLNFSRHLYRCGEYGDELMNDYVAYGTDLERKVLTPLRKALCRKNGDFNLSYKGVGVDFIPFDFWTPKGSARILDCKSCYTFYRDAIRLLLEYWEPLKTPENQEKLIYDHVCTDPLNFTDSEDETVRNVARSLVS